MSRPRADPGSRSGTSVAILPIVLRAAAAVLTLTLTAPLFAADGIPIVGYHEVDPTPRTGWGARTEDFVEQMELLDATGFHVVPISDLYDYLTKKRDALPSHPIVVTVDDGWLCASTEIAPVMRKFGFPWSLYVYPEIVGHGAHALTWPQVLALQADGVDIEDHTMTHAHLMRRSHPELDDAQYAVWLENELGASRKAIETHIGKPVRFVAYPYGDYDAAVEQQAKRDGYLLGLTSESGLNTRSTNLMRLRRLAVISDTTLDQFAHEIGLGKLTLENESPVVTTSTWTASIPDYDLIDPATVHVTVLGRPDVRGTYDQRIGRVSVNFEQPPRAREEVVVLIDDSRERRAAVVTLYGSDADREHYQALHDDLRELPLHHTETTRGVTH